MGPSFLPAVVDREIGGVIVPTVDARQLHASLRVGTLFASWITRRIGEYGLVAGCDFAKSIVSKDGNKSQGTRTPGRSSIDYALTIEVAKRLAASERNDVGKAILDHLLRCEERLRTADPEAHAESGERMREDIRNAGRGGDRPGTETGYAGVNPGDGDPTLVGRLVDELLAMGAEARAMRARDTQRTDREIAALREIHNEAVERAGILEEELAASELARRAAERAVVAARAARHDQDSDDLETGGDDASGPGASEDPLRDEAELDAVLANLPRPDLTLGKGDATRADRTMAFRLSGCRPVKPRPFRFWRAEHGSPGIAKGVVHHPGHATRGGNTYFMRKCAVRIFDALQALRQPSRASVGH